MILVRCIWPTPVLSSYIYFEAQRPHPFEIPISSEAVKSININFAPNSFHIGMSGDIPRFCFPRFPRTSPNPQRLRYAWVRSSGPIPPCHSLAFYRSTHSDNNKINPNILLFHLCSGNHTTSGDLPTETWNRLPIFWRRKNLFCYILTKKNLLPEFLTKKKIFCFNLWRRKNYLLLFEGEKSLLRFWRRK